MNPFPMLKNREAVAKLLTGYLVSTDPETEVTARALQEMGLAKIAYNRRYLLCASTGHPKSQECTGAVPLEGPGPYKCPECGRIIAHSVPQNGVVWVMRVDVSQQGVHDYLCALLKALGAFIVATTPMVIKAKRKDGQVVSFVLGDWVSPQWTPPSTDSHPYIYVYANADKVPRWRARGECFVLLAAFLTRDREWATQFLSECEKLRGVIG